MAGHRKGDGRYVLGREPDFIIIGGSEGYTFPWFVSDREIMASPRFRAEYELEERPLPPRDGTSGFIFRYYRRKLDSR